MVNALYRGKRKDGRGWEYGNLLVGKYHGAYIVSLTDDASKKIERINWVEVDPDTVSQYTGMQDKNGKKIFGGDIHDYCGQRFIVSFGLYTDTEETPFEAYGWYVGNPTRAAALIETEAWVNIIGNVHDNPELLEAQHGA